MTIQLPETEAVLRDGRRLRLRPAGLADIERVQSLLDRLSGRSLYLRFHRPTKRLNPAQLAELTTDPASGVRSYIATFGEGVGESIVGIGSWYTVGGDHSAEIAFVVDEALHARGVGTALLEQMVATAPACGINQFVAYVLPENSAMRGVFDASGLNFTRQVEEDDGLRYTIDLRTDEEFAQRRYFREHVARTAGMASMLRPRTIAVIGASRNPGKPGGALFRNLLQSHFSGTAYPVNKSAESVAGVHAYNSVRDVPGDVDLAVIAVPSEAVLDEIEDCAARNVQAIVVITAGFGEAGDAGRDLERRLKARSLSYGMRVVGPNCLGILNNEPDMQLNATFGPVTPGAGAVSMASQSGALGLALLDYADASGLGVRHFISLGNRLDVSSNDLLEFWEDDPGTRVIAMYLESFGNPRNFSRVARKVSRTKPIVAMKGGRSSAGARAASSHTGALAESSQLTDVLFKRSGVIAVDSLDDLFGVADILSNVGAPPGDRLAIATNSGGPGILAADSWARAGLPLANLSDASVKALRTLLPAAASVANPVDMLAAASREQYTESIKILLDDPGVDAVLVIHTPANVTATADVTSAIGSAAAASTSEKPVVACLMTWRSGLSEIRIDERRRVPVFKFPEDAASALARAREWARFRSSPEGTVVRADQFRDDSSRLRARDLLENSDDGEWLLPDVTLDLLRVYGIPVAETRVALSAEEAVAAADEIGWPVVMKVRSKSIVHKSDVNGVQVGLNGADEVANAFNEIHEGLQALDRAGDTQGVIVQAMAETGEEMVAGVTTDPVFGPVIMVGFGGTKVEVLNDVAFALHPLSDLDPAAMLSQLHARALLSEWRGRPARDVGAIADVLFRLSAIVEDMPEITDLEINPLFLFEQGKGCLVADARIRIGKRQVAEGSMTTDDPRPN